MDRKTGLNKKASERVPRGQTVENGILNRLNKGPSTNGIDLKKQVSSNHIMGVMDDLDDDRDYLHVPPVPTSKPGAGNPR